jgi:uncharacterized protein with ParB-like and HNH nuclease domain
MSKGEDNNDDVVDEAAEDEKEIPYKYAITSYGADYPVESIVQKLEKENIMIPFFQRGYVWTHVEAARFVETLLLGLPVPGVFLSKDENSQKLLVIDGQQRLLTLQYFYDGIFRQGPAEGKAFKLKNVQDQYEGKTYKTLSKEDKLRLDDSIIHATVVKQDDPEDDESSIYHIFERLNTAGRQLYPQEIRNCIYYGEFNNLLKELNNNTQWRHIFGKESPRQKDLELILRFFAMLFNAANYKRPMKEFLNKYMAKNRHLKNTPADSLRDIFNNTISIIAAAVPRNAFRPERALNAAAFDALMTGIARRLLKGAISNNEEIKRKYDNLLANDKFTHFYKTATSDEENVKNRLMLAEKEFEDAP